MFDLGSVFVTIKSKTEGFEQGLRKMQDTIDKIEENAKGMQRFADGAKEVGMKMTATFTAAAGIAGGLSVKAFSDLNEAVNATNVTFGKAADKIIAFGDTASTQVGLSKRAFLEASTPIGAALQNVGLSAGEAADWTINLTKRAADMASVFNTDVNDSLGAIQAGLRGEADPLERFGVGLNETAVKAYAMRTGLIKAGEELTDQQKTQARLGLLMEQTNRVQNDFVNTSDGLANKQRILKARLEDTAAQLGNKLAPYAQKVVDVLTRMVDWFSRLSDGQQKTILIVVGLVAILGPLLLIFGQMVSAIIAINTAITFLAANPMILAFTAAILVIAGLAYLIITNWETLKGWFSEFWAWITGIFQAAFNWIKDNWQMLITILLGPIGFFAAMVITYWDQIKAAAVAVFNAIKNFITAVWDGLVGAIRWYINLYISIVNGIIGGVKWAFQTAIDGVKAIWGGVTGWFSNIGSGIVGALSNAAGMITAPFKAAFNGIARLWNGSIGKLSFQAPDWVPGLGGKGFSMPRIPEFARGVRNFSGGLALINERGPELIDLPRGSNVYPANQTSRMLTQIGAGGGQQIIVNMDGANITSPQVADEYAELIGDRIIRRLQKTARV